jgi:hypothetical protein
MMERTTGMSMAVGIVSEDLINRGTLGWPGKVWLLSATGPPLSLCVELLPSNGQRGPSKPPPGKLLPCRLKSQASTFLLSI